jgi:hypothetical protein
MFDIYKVFYPEPRQYTFFSAAHGTFSKTDHNLGCKAVSDPSISDHNIVKLDNNNKRNHTQYSNT